MDEDGPLEKPSAQCGILQKGNYDFWIELEK